MWLLVVVIGLVLVFTGLTLKLFLVSVPEVTGLILLNQFGGRLRAVGSGFRLKWPWETYREENFFSLELVTKKFTETYAAGNGPLMEVKASYQYNPDERRLNRYIAVDKTTIEQGFTDIFSGILSEIIGAGEAEDVRKNIQGVQNAVIRQLDSSALTVVGENGTQAGTPPSVKEKLENQYGINWRLFAIADIDFAKDYQEARSGKARMAKIGETIAVLKSAAPLLDDKDAVNTVLVEQGKAKKSVFEIEGLSGAINDAVIKIFGGRK